jgi:hypothetical protein
MAHHYSNQQPKPTKPPLIHPNPTNKPTQQHKEARSWKEKKIEIIIKCENYFKT